MAFTGDAITIAGLVKIELPIRTLYLSDGGQVKWGAETYQESDADFGSIYAFEPQREGFGDMAPGSVLTFVPADGAAAATLSQPTYQNSRMRLWLAEVDATGNVTGTPELIEDMLLDSTVLRVNRGERILDLGMISRAEKLFLANEGNGCTARFHKSVWPGELGLDNANGAQVTVAWGVESPPRGSVSGANSFGGSGGFGIGGAGFGGGGGGFNFESNTAYV
jgi:hypothetical protein